MHFLCNDQKVHRFFQSTYQLEEIGSEKVDGQDVVTVPLNLIIEAKDGD